MSQDRLAQLRHSIRQATHADETDCVRVLLAQTPLDARQRLKVQARAADWVERCRAEPEKQGLLDAFLQEYSLSTREGVALMCLAEALLRIPDPHTADRLVSEKIRSGDWAVHGGNSDKLLVNTATCGLVLAGKVVPPEDGWDNRNASCWLRHLVSRIGASAVRAGLLQAMKLMGQHYVLGRTIQEAATRGAHDLPAGTRFSFDMLGEGARTHDDARGYFNAYMAAIRGIGERNACDDVFAADGISVKLSALHPRYQYSQRQCVLEDMLPRVLEMAEVARRYNIGFTIDAEEASRLDLSLDIFEALAANPRLAGWNGLGLVLQAYQKRALPLVDWLAELAAVTRRRLMVRLVKGAYWDAEIKHAQEQGLRDYPVYTRKAHSDQSYQVCASRLLALREHIHPQFASHNAYTIASILELLGDDRSGVEFQRLHGMGELLYGELARELDGALPLRVYAPVGEHRDLLPYLVRRLLENGANTSFVNRFLDREVSVSDVVFSPEDDIVRSEGLRHTRIPLPRDLFRVAGDPRDNARGLDLDDPLDVSRIMQALDDACARQWEAGPLVGGKPCSGAQVRAQYSPADFTLRIGRFRRAAIEDVDRALSIAGQARDEWQARGVEERAWILARAADELERQTERLTALISLEAGRTLNDGIAEVREAVDFCRYYANQACLLKEQGDGRLLEGRGIFVCISPWNFPLAIFTGQIVAALATGNGVIAKPAEQTSQVAVEVIRILHRAGIPAEVLHLLTGAGGEIGPLLLSDPRVAGVVFTGSTETARRIQSYLVDRGGHLPPLIAETGGQNAMLVDSTALPEQVVDDVIKSAFLSAGQRCSALRVLYLQEEVADRIIALLKGAVKTLHVGRPWHLSSDIGPVIDATARDRLLEHIARMDREATCLVRGDLPADCPEGHYLAPHIYQLESGSPLKQEVFGPVLHIVRYRVGDLDRVIREINDTGYGLTLGVHSRIRAFAEDVFARTRVGNTYVNRNMVGAAVGVNPFGGLGLSGTGFKAGGPHYLLRFTRLWPDAVIGDDTSDLRRARDVGPLLRGMDVPQWRWDRRGGAQRADILQGALAALAHQNINIPLHIEELALQCGALLEEARQRFDVGLALPGPAGEVNTLSLHGRGTFLVCLDPERPAAAIRQVIAALAAGNAVIIGGPACGLAGQIAEGLNRVLPEGLVAVAADGTTTRALILHDRLAGVAAHDSAGIPALLSRRTGAIIPLVTHLEGPFALLPYAAEKTFTDNVVATGGNALLLNLQE